MRLETRNDTSTRASLHWREEPALIPANRLAGITLASVAAGTHAVLIAQQASVWWGYGALMAAIAVVFAAIALGLCLRPTTGVVLAAIAGTVTGTVLYVVSRTAGLPFGPGPTSTASFSTGRAEAVGPIDLGYLLTGIALVVILVGLLPEHRRRAAVNALCCAATALWALRWTGVLA